MAGKNTVLEVKGLDKITKNLRREIGKIEGDVFRGINLAFAWLQLRIIKITPLEFGFLRNSFFKTVVKEKKRIIARIGFTISYAPFIHEKTTASFKTPGTQAKFLEKPIMENSERILQIIAQEAKIG